MTQEGFLLSTPVISPELAQKIISGALTPEDIYKMFGVATPFLLPLAEKIRPRNDFTDSIGEILFSAVFALVCLLDDHDNNTTAGPKINDEAAARIRDFLRYASVKAREQKTPFSYADYAIRVHAHLYPESIAFKPFLQKANGAIRNANAEALDSARRMSARALEAIEAKEVIQ